MTDRETHIASAYLRREHGKHGLRDVALSYRTLADFCRALPEYDRADVVRLYALTGGIPAAAQETDANLRFEGNLMRLLVYDSAFSRLLPQWMQESFRSPESYYPILDSIAGGHHRLSEIARDVGYAGNKCKTYLDALCQADFVALENREYRLKNSYYKAWCLYVYEGRRMQIGNARVLLDRVKATVDEQIAMPVFRESCLRYMLKADRDYLREGRQGELKRDEIVNVPGMGKVKLDFCFLLPHCSLIGVCPESLEAHITKETAAKIIYAVKEYYSLHDTDIVLFSAGRFSDWCVHQAAQLYWLHEVTTERLRY
ncbi:MAG: hypothetical protein KBS74_06805 [Clostridiales bacterium]|nr:hypothetical protein [Candidatus Cacconaster stercorequi]